MKVLYKKAPFGSNKESSGAENKREFYGKLAEWGERVGLALLVSLVIQQLLNNPRSLPVMFAMLLTAVVYTFSYFWLKKSKPF